MESELLQAIMDLGVENPEAKVEAILSYLKDSLDQARDQVIERVLDYISDILGIGRRELEPAIPNIVANIVASVSVPPPSASASLS